MFFPCLKTSVKELAKFLDKFILHKKIKEDYSKIASENKKLIELNPYAKELLTWLALNSISTGIVTSKDKLRKKNEGKQRKIDNTFRNRDPYFLLKQHYYIFVEYPLRAVE